MAQDDKTRANALIDKNSDSGGLNVDALCHELSQIVMQLTYTVFEVFNTLTEKGFNQSAHEQVATNLIRSEQPGKFNSTGAVCSRSDFASANLVYYELRS